MCCELHFLVPFCWEKEHLVTYEYLPESGRRCIDHHREGLDQYAPARLGCKRKSSRRDDKVAVIKWSRKMCPHKGCNGPGMPGEIRNEQRKIDWHRTVRIDVKSDEDEDEWNRALTKAGVYSEDQQTEISDATESIASFTSDSILESGERTPKGRRSPSSMTEEEIRQVSLARHEQREKSQRRLPRREIRRSETHPAQRSSKGSRGPGAGWPDLGAVGAELGRALEGSSDFGSDEGVVEFNERYGRLSGDRAHGDLHAVAQRRGQHVLDNESDVSSVSSRPTALGSVTENSSSFEDNDFKARENRYGRVEAEQTVWEAYHLSLQIITAESFAAAFPSDWPTEPIEKHIQTPQILRALKDPSSELSRFLYAMSLEAQIFSYSASEISRKLEDINEEPEYLDEEDEAPASGTSERDVLRWIERVEYLRPKLTKAMRRQFAECASSAERDELVFLLKVVGSEDMATEWVWRALCPNVSEYATPQYKGEAPLIEFADPEGRQERTDQMRDSQLAGKMGDCPWHWNDLPRHRKGKESLWNG